MELVCTFVFVRNGIRPRCRSCHQYMRADNVLRNAQLLPVHHSSLHGAYYGPPRLLCPRNNIQQQQEVE